jgi:hypothetical protein
MRVIFALFFLVHLYAAQNPDLKKVTIDGTFSVTGMTKQYLGETRKWDEAAGEYRPAYAFWVSSTASAAISCHSVPAGGIIAYTTKATIDDVMSYSHLTSLQDGGFDREVGPMATQIIIYTWQLGTKTVLGTPSVTTQPPLPGWQNINNVDTSRTGRVTL